MKRTMLGILVLTGLAACDDPARPAEPAVAPPAAAVAAERQLLSGISALGGRFSFAHGINEQGEVVGEADLPSGALRAFPWTR
jgi:hypothetical protein